MMSLWKSLWVVTCLCLVTQSSVVAGLFKMDFGTLENFDDLDDWDEFETFVFFDFDDEIAAWPLTDYSGEGDDDVVLTILDHEDLADEFISIANGMIHNNLAQQFVDVTYDGIEVPAAVKDDYLYRDPDTAGTELLFRFENLDPGSYNVTLFLGRTSDLNGQFGKIWVESDPAGKGEPEEENTGNFSAYDPRTGVESQEGNPVTLSVEIAADEFLWYGHMEDNSGGISGIIIRQTDAGGLTGDFNANGMLDADDMDLLSTEVRAGTNNGAFDLNGDALVNDADRDAWVQTPAVANTYYGDSNLDGEFGSGDLVVVFTAGKFDSGDAAGWAEGDWNGDGVFSSGDLVKAFQSGGFEFGPRAAQSVPEPSSIVLLGLGLALAARSRQSRSSRLPFFGCRHGQGDAGRSSP